MTKKHTFEITRGQFNRTAQMFRGFAKADVMVKFHNGRFWVYGTEQAIDRIWDEYGECDPNLVSRGSGAGIFYFVLVTPSFTGFMEQE